jgi:hypothetical protein
MEEMKRGDGRVGSQFTSYLHPWNISLMQNIPKQDWFQVYQNIDPFSSQVERCIKRGLKLPFPCTQVTVKSDDFLCTARHIFGGTEKCCLRIGILNSQLENSSFLGFTCVSTCVCAFGDTETETVTELMKHKSDNLCLRVLKKLGLITFLLCDHEYLVPLNFSFLRNKYPTFKVITLGKPLKLFVL